MGDLLLEEVTISEEERFTDGRVPIGQIRTRCRPLRDLSPRNEEAGADPCGICPRDA
jgi:hypothetical protein